MFMELNISVEVENPLGKVRSDAVILDSEYIVKTDPPRMWKWSLRRGFPHLCLCVGNTPLTRSTSPSSTTSATAQLGPTCGRRSLLVIW
ncbi:hypothetical protein ANANG_G00230980 [Anguilla anguilla]|uniref:Uncharacterized protein n=1 Tax=Anguilla anguilla TaxID=7936 RepID=A0A9D3LVU2_ANGAN|nr:hypothetical protein ANANG_G00230980 [Anguilla anguilla]